MVNGGSGGVSLLEMVPLTVGITHKTECFDLCGMWGKRILLSILVVCFLVHTPITEAALRMLACRSIEPEAGASYDIITDARREAFEEANVTSLAKGASIEAELEYNRSTLIRDSWLKFGSAPSSQG